MMKLSIFNFQLSIFLLSIFLLTGCKSSKTSEGSTSEDMPVVAVTFSADSAYQYCAKQCEFGPRVMNSEAHEKCVQWIEQAFKQYGCTVTMQKADLKGYDGTILHSTNIIASNRPDLTDRIMICAHYDSRPWADNDPDESNHKTPVMAANDGASGVGVMIELARLLQSADSAKVGVDFICFDAEDYGTPEWYQGQSQIEDPWALGAQYWAKTVADGGFKYKPRFGILLDMVGGEGSIFYHEANSLKMAKDVIDYVWHCASIADCGNVFTSQPGGYITDDHVPVNQIAKIPCIDIIPYYPDCQQSSFGPTWHTVNDTMEHISKQTLQSVGQTLVQVIYSLK